MSRMQADDNGFDVVHNVLQSLLQTATETEGKSSSSTDESHNKKKKKITNAPKPAKTAELLFKTECRNNFVRSIPGEV